MLEKEIDEMKNKSKVEITLYQKNSEESLKQLKSYYESERERLERKIIEEKENHNRTLNNTIEEFESRLKTERNNHEEQMDNTHEAQKELEIQAMANNQRFEK